MKDHVRRSLLSVMAVGLAALLGHMIDVTVPAYAGGDGPVLKWYARYSNRSTVLMHGTLRDFYKKNKREMEPDFDKWAPKLGSGQYFSMLSDRLDAEGKPVMNDTGYVYTDLWMDSADRNIMIPCQYIASWPGDYAVSGKKPKKNPKDLGDALFASEQIEQCWRDVGDVNESYDADITFDRQPDGSYLFNAELPKGTLRQLGYPKGKDDIFDLIASGEWVKKRYTWEGETTFVYESGAGWWFTAGGMDDVWVYIDGRLVIDMGGAFKHGNKRPESAQRIDIDRLGWLTDGKAYTLKVFMADRDKMSKKTHLTLSTNIPTLNLVVIPAVWNDAD